MQKRLLCALLIAFFSGPALTQVVERGFYVFDGDRTHLSTFLSHPTLTVDHASKSGYELYGPKGTERFLQDQGVDFIALEETPFDPIEHWKNLAGYPTPEEIAEEIKNLVNANQDILQLSSIGKSWEQRDLWVVKVSDNVTVDEIEPETKYIANMHGNEIVGRELMVRFLKDLVVRYRAGEAEVVSLIDNTEVFIMPTMNPDGSAKRRRGNSRWSDLNRNFPDFTTGDNRNDPEGREPETSAIMKFQASRNFALSANFHGGTICVNYPWDTSAATAPLTPLIIALSKEYASKVPGMHNSNQFPDGIVNGYSWYEVNGGMQDWSYNWYGDLQVTIELSHTKWPNYSQMDQFYLDNKWSLLRYLTRVHQGAGFNFDDQSLSGSVEITRLSGWGEESLIGTYSFGRGEFYKVLPEGTYRFALTNEQGLDTSFVTSVNFLKRNINGNYRKLSKP